MKFSRDGTISLLVLISTAVFLFSGCTVFRPVGDFIGQQYVNTVSYFNTFYNARKLYNEAVNDLQQVEMRHRQQNREGQPDIPPNVREKFNSVIEKCSRLLHQHPTSRFADDAVLMIGNSYYHMGQNVQAERKFLELLAEFPQSRLVPQAQILLAKTQIRMNKHDLAEITLRNLLERIDRRRHRDVVARAHLELGDIAVHAGNVRRAIEEYELAVANAQDREIRTEARFRQAYVYYQLGLTEEAFEKFGEAINDRPTEQILFESHIARTRILVAQGRYPEALELLDGMLQDLRLVDYVSRIELEIADVYRAEGFYIDAIDQYVYVDTTYARSAVSVRAQYELGLIYRDVYGDFKRAREYFERVARSTPQTDLTRNARTAQDHLNRYWKHRNEIIRLDSVIAHQQRKVTELTHRLNQSEGHTSEDTASYNGSLGHGEGAIQNIAAELESLRNQITTNTEQLIRNYYELAGLFFIEMARPDSAIHYYSKLAFEFPTSQYAPQSLYALAELVTSAGNDGYDIDGMYYLFGEEFASVPPPRQRDYIYNMLIERYPETEFALEAKRIQGREIMSLQEDTVKVIYRDAEDALFGDNHGEALSLFRKIVRDHPESAYTPRAAYAMGWIYENILVRPDSAVAYYRIVVDHYPDTEYAKAVAAKVEAWNAEMGREEEEVDKVNEKLPGDIADSPAEERSKVDANDERPRRGIPLARPTDIMPLEEKPDTTRIKKEHEN